MSETEKEAALLAVRSNAELGRDEVVLLDGDFAIIRTYAIFCSGFNCYKAITPNGSDFVKINDPLSFFISIENAEEWLAEYKMSNV